MIMDITKWKAYDRFEYKVACDLVLAGEKMRKECSLEWQLRSASILIRSGEIMIKELEAKYEVDEWEPIRKMNGIEP